MSLTLRLTPRTERTLNALAKRRQMSRPDFVREAVARYEAAEAARVVDAGPSIGLILLLAVLLTGGCPPRSSKERSTASPMTQESARTVRGNAQPSNMTTAGANVATSGLQNATRRIEPSAQPAAPDPNAWTVEYRISGGFAGFVHSITVRHTGDLEAIDSRLRYHARSHAPEDLMTRIRAALGKLTEPRPQRTYPDLPQATLVVTRDGHPYAFADEGDLVNRLEDAFRGAVSAAVQGTWWESGRKLCRPPEKLTREDVDVSIETLELGKSGTFHLAWQKGDRGAPASHEEGTWRIDLRTAAFHIEPADGAPRRNLKRDGWFSINENTLTLRNVWFGTVRAAQTPDVCELTLTRK